MAKPLKLTAKQMLAVQYKIEHPDATYPEVAKALKINVGTLNNWRLNELVAEFLKPSRERAQAEFERGILDALQVLRDCMDSDDDQVRLKAANSWLDRALGKPPQSVDLNHGMQAGFSLEEVVSALRRKE